MGSVRCFVGEGRVFDSATFPRPGQGIQKSPGGGRKPLPYRQVFEGIVYVLRTGCQWKALPKERFGCASAIHRYFLEWAKAGFFLALWRAGLTDYDELPGTGKAWMVQ